MKKKQTKRRLQFNISLNLSIILAITVLGIIGYYYSNINYLFTTNNYFSDSILNGVFLLISVAEIIYVFMEEDKKKKRVLMYVLLGVSSVFFVLGFIQNIFSITTDWYIMLAKVGCLLSVFVTTNTILLYSIGQQVDVLNFNNGIEVINTKTLHTISAKFIFFVGFLTVLPFAVLQSNTFIEQCMLAILYFVGAATLSIVNYMNVRKTIYEPNGNLVEKHQYLILKSMVLPKEKEQIDLSLEKSVKVREQLNIEIDALENNRENLVVLELNTPELERQLTQIVDKLSVYDKKAMHEKLIESNKKAENIKQKIWQEEFEEEYNHKMKLVKQSEEQLKVTKLELTSKTEQVNEMKQEKSLLETNVVAMLEEQNDQKQMRHDVSENKASQLQMLGDESLTDKERKTIQSKIEKLTKKESEIDVKISQLEDDIMKSREEKDLIEKTMSVLETSEIPDLSYVIQTKEEELTVSKERVKEIETAYNARVESDQDLENVYAIISTTTQELKTVAELEEQKEEVHQQLSVDVDKEKTGIDGKVAEILETIAKQTLIEEQIQKDKKELEKEIIDVKSEMNELFE